MTIPNFTEMMQDIVKYGPDHCRRVEIPLYAALASAVPGSDTYKVPSTHKLYITDIRGHLAMISVATEPLGVGLMVGQLTMQERIALKAMNARLQLMNQDLTQYLLGENHPANLASLIEQAGGKPIHYEMPHIVPAGQTLRLDVNLVDSTAAVIGSNTEYGVVLSGFLLRTRGDTN